MYKRTRWGFAFLALFIGLMLWLLAPREDPVTGRRSVPIQLGIDLQGGTELVYQLDLRRIADEPSAVANEVKDIIARRLDAYGLKEISIAVEGQNRLVVQLPGFDPQGVEDIKRTIERAGVLTFRLVVRGDEHTRRIPQYLQEEREYRQAELEWAHKKREWDRRRKAAPGFAEPLPRKPKPPEYIVRHRVEKVLRDGKEAFEPREQVVLINREDSFVDGRFLARAEGTYDENFNRAVAFTFTGEGAARFADLTGNHVDDPLAIVLDEDVMQVATIKSRISTSGQLTGNYTDEEVKSIVTILRGGSLPTSPELISESAISSTLGQAAVTGGARAVAVGLAAVMLCMAIYYLAGGLVANFALLFNIFAILAYVACFRQTLTLPGIAGILLSIGMAVDANILIFERVREERARGKSLMQAITTGYQRAFSVIFDSNLTTIITGLALFNFGTGLVKGFAVTLIAGILVSFFSAIFVTRLILSGLYNLGWLKRLKMLQAFETPRVPFVAFSRPFTMASIVLIVLSWALVFHRGAANYGIDFTGGARIDFRLKNLMARDQLEAKVQELARARPELFRDWSLQAIGAGADHRSRDFALLTRPGAEGRSIARAQEALPEPEPPAAEPGAEASDALSPPDPQPLPEEPPQAAVAPPVEELEEGGDELRATQLTAAHLVKAALEEMLRAEDLLVPPGFPPEAMRWELQPGTARESLVFEVNLEDVQPEVTKEWIQSELSRRLAHFQPRETAGFHGIRVDEVELAGQEEPGGPQLTRYRLRLTPYETPQPGSPFATQVPTHAQVFDVVRAFFNDPPQVGGGEPFQLSNPFPQVSTVGPRVASNLQQNAIIAVFLSLLGIIFYVSLRFEFNYGVGAIAALVHDVLVTIGIIAVMDHFLGTILPLKINLPEVAALLTIIGYSINDTIVLFDRIRENLRNYGKKKLAFRDCVDMSINQTLARTLWTSATVLATVVALLIFGGPALRGFSFALAVGLVAGTYSTLFIATPVVIYLEQRSMARREALAEARA
jgi:SecD/SecF fusion protein